MSGAHAEYAFCTPISVASPAQLVPEVGLHFQLCLAKNAAVHERRSDEHGEDSYQAGTKSDCSAGEYHSDDPECRDDRMERAQSYRHVDD